MQAINRNGFMQDGIPTETHTSRPMHGFSQSILAQPRADICCSAVAALFVKQLLDILCAVSLLLLLSPVIVILSLLIYMDTAASVIYRSPRLGKYGRQFIMYKFRTMVVDADRQLDHDPALKAKFMSSGFKLVNDARVTRLGAFLRRTCLDEIPQLANILKGEMSLVGPRPILPEEREFVAPERFQVLPGLTGLWQVSGKNTLAYLKKNEFDVFYVQNFSLRMDFALLLKTLPTIIRGVGFPEEKK